MKKVFVLILAILTVFCFVSCVRDDAPQNGKSAYEIWLDQGHEGTEDDFLEWLKGASGKDGANGSDGLNGSDGKSAYQIWLDQGFIGTESDFFEWLSYSQNPQGLDFFPLKDGTYAVSIGNAIYLDEINIPETYNRKKVTVILESAFEQHQLKKVTIPDTITTIEKNAFDSCFIKELVLGNGIKEIGEQAFLNSQITELFIPASVTSIGDLAFDGCSFLKSITVSEENQSYKSVDGVLYSKDGKTLILYPRKKESSSFTVPNGVITIKQFAFSNCNFIENVIVPEGVTSIEKHAFGACNNLKTISFPKTLASIDTYAFWSCLALKEVIIPSSVSFVGERAFYFCISLSTINCEAQSQPTTWHTKWNESIDSDLKNTIFIPAKWDYVKE